MQLKKFSVRLFDLYQYHALLKLFKTFGLAGGLELEGYY